MPIKMSRAWAMPSQKTFKIRPIKLFIGSVINPSIDPFSRGAAVATITNDLNKSYYCDYYLDALEFFKLFRDEEIKTVLFDPPYSPRQLKECYDNIGEALHDTKSSVWKSWKDEIMRVTAIGGEVLSFGWNTVGMGKNRGFELVEILLVCHGGNHNDTICLREVKICGMNERKEK